MPYTPAQCRKFAADPKHAPKDWREHCRGVKQGKKGVVKKKR